MKLFKNFHLTSEIRPVFLRALSQITVISYILLYFAAKLYTNDWLVYILSFSTSTGIFWMIMILIILGHLEFLEKIIKDVARSKISEFAASSYFKNSINQLLEDEKFKEGVRNIINPSKSTADAQVIPSSQEELDSGNKV